MSGNSSSISQRMVSRIWFGHWHGRFEPYLGSYLTSTRYNSTLWIQWLLKIIPAEVKKTVNLWEETQYENKRPMLTSRQIMFHIFSSFNINKTQGHTCWTWVICLIVEPYNDNVKMFNQAWEETSQVLGNVLDEHVLENLYERQVKKSTLVKNAMTL